MLDCAIRPLLPSATATILGGGGGCVVGYCRDRGRLTARDFAELEIAGCLGWVVHVGKFVMGDGVWEGSEAYIVQGFRLLEWGSLDLRHQRL